MNGKTPHTTHRDREAEALLFEKSVPGREGVAVPALDVEEVKPEDLLPPGMVRNDIEGFPELSELDTVRHFTRLSQLNVGIDTVFYPLGSCTMKYNPKVNEDIASMNGFSSIHPYQPVDMEGGGSRSGSRCGGGEAGRSAPAGDGAERYRRLP